MSFFLMWKKAFASALLFVACVCCVYFFTSAIGPIIAYLSYPSSPITQKCTTKTLVQTISDDICGYVSATVSDYRETSQQVDGYVTAYPRWSSISCTLWLDTFAALGNTTWPCLIYTYGEIDSLAMYEIYPAFIKPALKFIHALELIGFFAYLILSLFLAEVVITLHNENDDLYLPCSEGKNPFIFSKE